MYLTTRTRAFPALAAGCARGARSCGGIGETLGDNNLRTTSAETDRRIPIVSITTGSTLSAAFVAFPSFSSDKLELAVEKPFVMRKRAFLTTITCAFAGIFDKLAQDLLFAVRIPAFAFLAALAPAFSSSLTWLSSGGLGSGGGSFRSSVSSSLGGSCCLLLRGLRQSSLTRPPGILGIMAIAAIVSELALASIPELKADRLRAITFALFFTFSSSFAPFTSVLTGTGPSLVRPRIWFSTLACSSRCSKGLGACFDAFYLA